MDKPLIHRLKVNGSWHSFVEPLQRREAFTTPTGNLRGEPVDTPWRIHPGRLPMGWTNTLFEESPMIDYVVFSYGTPIAWHSRNGWTTPDVRYSVSTSKHQGRIFTAVEYVKNGSSAIGG